jgi:hypothetical protein
MRHLLHPRVLNQASLAAALSALACYPRLLLWLHPSGPIWYLEATLFICGIMLWSFVFAWHTPYTNRPVFVLKLELVPFTAATIGILAATVVHLWLDPLLRTKMPDEYPADLKNWIASLLFPLALTQLFLIFAPFDWLLRMFKHRWLATSLTALFGAFVLAMKINSLATPIATPLVEVLLAGRAVMALLVVYFYLRGGVILVSWWTLLFEARHLPGLIGDH